MGRCTSQFGLGSYQWMTRAAAPLIRRHLSKRAARGKEDPARLHERLGRPSLPRPDGCVIWVHAASVGESVAALPLINALLDQSPERHVLLTTGTLTSAQQMAARLPERAIHQFVPVDTPAAVSGFLDHWRPDAALWIESELWPNLVTATRRRRIPLALVNARMSETSFRRWRRLSAVARPILTSFDVCLAQSEPVAHMLAELGANEVHVTGNLKLDAEPLPVNDAELTALKTSIGERPVWLAASTFDGEEMLAGRVHSALRGSRPGLLTIIVPRHPERGDKIATDLRESGLTVAQRSKGEAVTPSHDILLGDTMGEMGLFYRVAPIVLMGKSLISEGGQNPLEPARLDCAILHGPHVSNFAEIYRGLDEAGAALEIASENALLTVLDSLLDNSGTVHDIAAKAATFVDANSGALERTLKALAPLLKERPHATA